MPVYEFYCGNCDNHASTFAPMKDAPTEFTCVTCGRSDMVRIWSFSTGNKEYKQPIISQSLAIHPEQAAEHRAAFPDVKLTDEQFPTFENYQQHDKYLEKSGFVKRKGMHTRKTIKQGKVTKRVTMGDVHRRLETEQGNTETVLRPDKE